MSEQNPKIEAAEQQVAAVQTRNLNTELQALAKFGGFNVLESSVDGIQNLNPERKARRNIYLTSNEKAAERKELAKSIEMWVEMLKSGKSITEMIDACQKKSAAVSDLLSQNQLKAVEEVKQLEKSYRTVMLFYKNTDSTRSRMFPLSMHLWLRLQILTTHSSLTRLPMNFAPTMTALT